MTGEASDNKNNYDDIINLPHPVSPTHPRMSIYDRAAQFSPFAALTGHEDAINETIRLTQERIELDEYSKQQIDLKLQLLLEKKDSHPLIEVTYFVPDEKKSGGSYETISDNVIKIDTWKEQIVFETDQRVPIKDIINLEGEIWNGMD